MTHVLAVTGPIYLLIALGWVAVRRGWFGAADLRVFGRFMITLCLPALVFDAISRRAAAEVLHAPFLVAYAAGSLAVLLGGVWWARRSGASPAAAALQGMGMACPNSGYVGYPILLQVLGPVAGVVLALAMLVENLLTIPLALAMAESGGQASRRAAVLQALRSLARMPLLWSIVLGFAFALLELRLPEPLARTLGLLGTASTPLALFIIGGTLVGLKLDGGMRVDLLRVALGKLVLHPLAVLLMVLILPPFDPALRTGVVLAAAMPMMSIYPVLAQRFGQERPCAAALLTATVLSFVTINLALVGLRLQPGWLPG